MRKKIRSKKKHRCERDLKRAEREKTSEAMRILRYEEELRLEELPAHASGAYFSAFPADIAMESQNPIIPPPTAEISPNASLSLMDTTSTTTTASRPKTIPSHDMMLTDISAPTQTSWHGTTLRFTINN